MTNKDIDEIQRIPVFEVDAEPGNVVEYLDERLKALKASNEHKENESLEEER